MTEVQEACEVQSRWLQTPKSSYNISSLINKWNNRKPWIGDELSFWSDFISWRQTFFSFLSADHNNSNIFYAKSVMVNIFC